MEVSHPNIVEVFSIKAHVEVYYIFMRYAEVSRLGLVKWFLRLFVIFQNGDMLDFIRKRGAQSEARAKFWFRQMANAIKYLHNLEIAHRDLKLENVLLSKNWNVLLADFGFSRKCVDDDVRILSTTFCGSEGKFNMFYRLRLIAP